MSLLECVPNVSEGRRPGVLAALAGALRRPGVHLLDSSADTDHNRSVFTLVGEQADLLEGLVSLARTALESIDLRRHQGAHPCIGALDVVPFIPLGGAAMATAVSAARELGERLGGELKLPVFLYEEAATRPERRNLAVLRRGGVHGLRETMSAVGEPDFGPTQPHRTGGATAVGARFFLVAYNVVLETSEVAVARRIANRIRETNGGLPAVKALGVDLASRRRAQVSMNLVDYRRTDLPTAFERVAVEAEAEGTSVLESEIIGLVPRAALGAVTASEIRLRGDLQRRILENHLETLA